MDLRISTLFVMLTYCFWYGEARNYSSILTVTNGARWGIWGKPSFCNQGYATGFSVKVEPFQGSLAWNDDTSLNAIRLYCSSGEKVMSTAGEWGSWKKPEYCSKGRMISFSLQVEAEQGPVTDDTAANNIKFICDGGSVLTGDSHNWGTFGAWSEICALGAICGIQTKVEPSQGSGDDTALNDVKFFCCD